MSLMDDPGLRDEVTRRIEMARSKMKYSDRAKIEIEGAEGVFTQHDLLDKIAALVDRLGTRTLTARHLQISLPYLSDVMLGRRPISAKLAQKLGFRGVTLFLK